jgi:methyltransferase (TIGR00027 family)
MQISQPVARTAFYCCILRADDARSSTPVCGDSFAERFIDDDVRRDLAPLLGLGAPAASNVARHRIIDDLIREQLASDPNRRVILIGAGFDTRACRIKGGRWFELDDPPLLAFKEQRLPVAEALNPLTRIPVVFDADPPERYLAPLAGDDQALVIVEGVSMYLSDSAIATLATTLAKALPRATLVCDLMSPAFARTFSAPLRNALSKMGARFGERHGHPIRQVETAGYRCLKRISIPGRAGEAGTLKIPRWVLATFLRVLRDGYQVFVFQIPAP